MQIDVVFCLAPIEDKLLAKHAVTVREVRQVLLSSPRIRFAEKGHREGKEVSGIWTHLWRQISERVLHVQAGRQLPWSSAPVT